MTRGPYGLYCRLLDWRLHETSTALVHDLDVTKQKSRPSYNVHSLAHLVVSRILGGGLLTTKAHFLGISTLKTLNA